MFCSIVGIVLLLLFSPPSLYAENLSLTVHQRHLNDTVLVTVANNASQAFRVDSASIALATKNYSRDVQEAIPPGQAKDILFTVTVPDQPGTYLLTTTIRYFNGGQVLSLRHAGFFHVKKPALLSSTCSIEDTTIGQNGKVLLRSLEPELWHLTVPEEIRVTDTLTSYKSRVFTLENTLTGFRGTYPVFGVAEKTIDGTHHAGLCSATLFTDSDIPSRNKGRIPTWFFLVLTLTFFSVSLYLLTKIQRPAPWVIAAIKSTTRMFFLTFSLYLLKGFATWLGFSRQAVRWKLYQDFVQILLDNFSGPNYLYFFQFFVDPYFGLCLLLVFPYFFWLDRGPVAQQDSDDWAADEAKGTVMQKEDASMILSADKYVSLFLTIASIPRMFAGKPPYWSQTSKLGLFTIMVKLFFIPLMVSWAIGGIFHLGSQIRSFQWDMYFVNTCLVQFMILLDTWVFSIGYLVESRFLKNEIRSIEPTLLGWIVCLWCYPPFNQFSFRPFDYHVIRITLVYPAWFYPVITCIISLLWGIFVWATLALGSKASNLTNRGIVRSGPYRFARHPAYTAKVLIWILQGIFFAQFGIFILIGFVVLYALRAWTEERHLAHDPEYIAYKNAVKWRSIPGLV